jgi:hypothetical protein
MIDTISLDLGSGNSENINIVTNIATDIDNSGVYNATRRF